MWYCIGYVLYFDTPDSMTTLEILTGIYRHKSLCIYLAGL